MIRIRRDVIGHTLLWLALLAVVWLGAPADVPAMAAEPMATATPTPAPTCSHVATADSIKIFYCEDIHLFINDLGFMAFEP